MPTSAAVAEAEGRRPERQLGRRLRLRRPNRLSLRGGLRQLESQLPPLALHAVIRRIGGLVLLLALVLAAGCAKNPVTGKRELTLVSSDQELQMGREGHQAIVAEYGIYDDPAITAYVDSIGHRLARVSHLPNLEWHFTVLDDPVVNAFALPGGYIYITRGILAYLNSEAQLAGVLGHEIGHVTARHSAKQVTNQTLAGLGLGVATVFSKTFSRYSQAAVLDSASGTAQKRRVASLG